ncbi:hypothetical protein [Desulfovibrio sp. ZJ200]|uniref:hypothetical protein n=1 Tax=Desulfovibrio sp. ZJ200 TaxID=2709792 RepID=UPI0013EE0958|nr:hypothetical protein [Desulfovibrio sp. ZJ200]
MPPEHFLFENALLTRKRQPPQRGVHSGENRVFRLNATFDFHKKSKVICSKGASTINIYPYALIIVPMPSIFSATARHSSCIKDRVLAESVSWATAAVLSLSTEGG